MLDYPVFLFLIIIVTPYKFGKARNISIVTFDVYNCNSSHYQCLTVMGTVSCVDEFYCVLHLFCFYTILFVTFGLWIVFNLIEKKISCSTVIQNWRYCLRNNLQCYWIIIGNADIWKLLIFHILIDEKQVKQQPYSEKRYPIKSFTVPSETCSVMKHPPRLCFSKSHKYYHCDKVPYIPLVPQGKPLLTCPLAELTPHLCLSLSAHQQTLFKVCYVLQEWLTTRQM